MCIWLPGWPIQRLRRARPALDKPLVLYLRARRGKMLVSACCVDAARLGIMPGMPLAEAKALTLETGIHFEAHDPRADHEALQALAVACQRFSPLVTVEETEMVGCVAGPKSRRVSRLPQDRQRTLHTFKEAEQQPDSLLLDITGCGPCFGGETALVRRARSWLAREGYQVRLAVADTFGAAWAMAHCSPESEPILAPGRQVAALQPLPVEALRLTAPTLQALHAFDLRTIEQVLALPRIALASHFPAEVIGRLDQALGETFELLTPEHSEEPVEACWPVEPPTADRRILEAVLDHLLDQILEKLRPRPVGVQRLVCSLRLVAGPPIQVPVGLLQASVSARRLNELLRFHLERLRLTSEVALVVLRADTAALEFRQDLLFEDGTGLKRWPHFPTLIERLSHRLGETAVLCPRLWPDAQPEFAFRYEPWLRQERALTPAQSLPLARHGAASERPLCVLRQPAPLLATSLVPGEPPPCFVWHDQNHQVAHFRGPERIETGWWRERDVRRDYYLVETTTGQRFWLFRAIPEDSWFLHGTFV
jgi:protein ImuB